MQVARTLTIPAVAVGLLTVASCTADTGTETDAPSPDTSETATPVATDPPSSPSPTAGDTGTTDAAQCLEGEWEGELWGAQDGALGTVGLGELQVEPEVATSGDSWVSFEDSTMTSQYEDRTTTVTLASEDALGEVVVTAVLDGTVTGTYTAEGDTLTVSQVDVSGLTAENRAELAGQDYDLPGLEGADLDTLAVDTTFTFECSQDELRLTPTDVPVPDAAEGEVDAGEVEDAVELVLTRR